MDKNGMPDVLEQVPAGGNPMQPQSGTYGDVVATERLKQQLDVPGGGPGGAAPAPTAPPPPGAPQGAQVPSAPGGVPDVLLRPTSQPDVPPSTPLESGLPSQSAAVTASHVSALQALVSSPTTSEATKAWAKTVLQRYGQ